MARTTFVPSKLAIHFQLFILSSSAEATDNGALLGRSLTLIQTCFRFLHTEISTRTPMPAPSNQAKTILRYKGLPGFLLRMRCFA